MKSIVVGSVKLELLVLRVGSHSGAWLPLFDIVANHGRPLVTLWYNGWAFPLLAPSLTHFTWNPLNKNIQLHHLPIFIFHLIPSTKTSNCLVSIFFFFNTYVFHFEKGLALRDKDK